MLAVEEDACSPAGVSDLATQRSVVAVHGGSATGVSAAHEVAVEHEIEHAACSFGVVLGSWVGHHFNALDCCGRHILEDHGGVGVEHHVGFAVHIDLEGG